MTFLPYVSNKHMENFHWVADAREERNRKSFSKSFKVILCKVILI